MNLKEIRELMDLMTEKDIVEFEMEGKNQRIRIRRATAADGVSPITFTSIAPALAANPAVAARTEIPLPAPKVEEELHILKSPIVGTFYETPSPGAAPFVQVGDSVEAGQVVCIIEAMKLMNEIEADVAGVIEKRFVSNQQPVEYGEALYGIRKK